MSEAARLTRSPSLSIAAEYAYASVVASGSRLVFAAGACPLDEAGDTVDAGDVRAQATQMMRNLRAAGADADARLEDVVRTTVYVASSEQRDLVAAWEVVRDALAPPRDAEHSARRLCAGLRPPARRGRRGGRATRLMSRTTMLGGW